jgi:hypothetical protein
MTHLREHISLASSASEAEARLENYFASLRSSNGMAVLRLRVPIEGLAGPLGISIEREVRVEARLTRDDENLNDLIRIWWGPEGRTILPTFNGTLIVWGETGKELSYIELDGAYTPPLGAAGQAFDEIIGHRIAASTAREFLKDLKRAIENRSATLG